ncbi:MULTISPECIES: hypothetical protein [Flavobacterium]|uniref:Lipoprotein n=1 Tax=Flavobacterium hankyongi TaxID=1176532 RepID=A0ABP8ZPA5_9FLAO|nr:hypothetical protein [Flavobacterium sp. N1846]
MKKHFILSILALSLIGCATAQNDGTINQKLDSKSDKEIVLVKVIDDSRCPEGVQCIWAGEVTIELAAYENGKVVEQVQFTYNTKSEREIVSWFTKHLPSQKIQLKGISVLPYPKDGVPRKLEDYFIKLNY